MVMLKQRQQVGYESKEGSHSPVQAAIRLIHRVLHVGEPNSKTHRKTHRQRDRQTQQRATNRRKSKHTSSQKNSNTQLKPLVLGAFVALRERHDLLRGAARNQDAGHLCCELIDALGAILCCEVFQVLGDPAPPRKAINSTG